MLELVKLTPGSSEGVEFSIQYSIYHCAISSSLKLFSNVYIDKIVKIAAFHKTKDQRIPLFQPSMRFIMCRHIWIQMCELHGTEEPLVPQTHAPPDWLCREEVEYLIE